MMFANKIATIRNLLDGYVLLAVQRHHKQWSKWHVWLRYDPKTWIETTACGREVERADYARSRLVDSSNLEDDEILAVCRPCLVRLANLPK